MVCWSCGRWWSLYLQQFTVYGAVSRERSGIVEEERGTVRNINRVIKVDMCKAYGVGREADTCRPHGDGLG